jgi:hypothetical protein
MRQLTILFIILSTHTFGQNLPDFGKVKSDNKFCNRRDTQVDYDTTYNISRICNSKNILEIRLSIASMPILDLTLITLTYDTLGGWQAFKYKDNMSDAWYDTTLKRSVTKIKLKPKTDFETLFDALKGNDIFTLPDQKDLKINNFVLDGVGYSITFKVDDKFRQYHFNNPGILIERNKKVKELRKYTRIVQLLWGMTEE